MDWVAVNKTLREYGFPAIGLTEKDIDGILNLCKALPF